MVICLTIIRLTIAVSHSVCLYHARNMENSTIDGTFSYEGKTYTAFYAEIAKVQVTQTAIYIEMKAQFVDENENYMQIVFKFQGSANTQNKQ